MRRSAKLPLLALNRSDDFPLLAPMGPAPLAPVAVGGDLSVDRLLAAYSRGIFPWFGAGEPIAWWSPDPRMVLQPARFKCQRSLRQRARSCGWRISADRAFLPVLHACAQSPRAGQRGTWIVPAMQVAYCALHRRGHAHSIEVWDGHELIGGLYGVSIGQMFFGESMFSQRSDASKIALWALCTTLNFWGWPLIDCQMETPHLLSLGAGNWPRSQFLEALKPLVQQPGAGGSWRGIWPLEWAGELVG